MEKNDPTYNDADNQLIEDYLDGILSEQDKKIVAERLQSDANFAAQLQLHQDIKDVLDAQEKMSLKDNWALLMEEAEQEMLLEEKESPLKVASKSSDNQTKNNSFNWWRIAAAILIFLIPALLYMGGVFDFTQVSPQELAIEYFETPETIALSMRSAQDGIDNRQALAKKQFEKKDYKGTLIILEELSKRDSIVNISEVQFSMGICHYLLGDYKKASQNFVKVDKQDGIKSKANWYLALAYLQQNETTKAKQLLEEIAQSDASKKRREKAKKLLRKL